MEGMRPQDRIIVAADVPSLERLNALVTSLKHWVGFFKIGMELQTAVGGPQAMECVRASGGRVMYDAKFADIPATMKGATAALLRTVDANFFTVHASAGVEAMKAAAEVKGGMLMLAVTVLTSLDENACTRIFGATKPLDKVLQFAGMALEAGADGIVCSPQELKMIRTLRDLDSLKLVIPGIR
ncbi:MAG: orotidine-5'-phosphate decarboxylase, partial [Candidatus Uhrbacteria bacterium]|nr:orotidine-5'-phosphate decarboxylase [Candidatus Uhrbacteria bacterium]